MGTANGGDECFKGRRHITPPPSSTANIEISRSLTPIEGNSIPTEIEGNSIPTEIEGNSIPTDQRQRNLKVISDLRWLQKRDRRLRGYRRRERFHRRQRNLKAILERRLHGCKKLNLQATDQEGLRDLKRTKTRSFEEVLHFESSLFDFEPPSLCDFEISPSFDFCNFEEDLKPQYCFWLSGNCVVVTA